MTIETNPGDHSEQWKPVSFILPAHNEERYLPGTLTALKTAIELLKIECEMIVVNDDSTDLTAEIARSAGATVIDVHLRNIGAVRNAGARQAQHPWLVFIDADTQIAVETLRATLGLLGQGYVGGGARVKLSDEKPISIVKKALYACVVFVWHIAGKWAAGCYMFCLRDEFFEFGGFDERYFAAEELFFSLNLKKRGKFGLVQIPVVTSARKLHDYSVWQLFRFLVAPLKRFWAPLQSPKGLEMLYKDDRGRNSE